jgi:esterase/lipase superfamily enzyme
MTLKILIAVSFLFFSGQVRAQTAENLIRLAAAHLGANTQRIFSPSIEDWRQTEGRQALATLQTLGPIHGVLNADSIVVDGLWLVVGRSIHHHGASDWTLIYSQSASKITRIRLNAYQNGAPLPEPFKLPISRGTESAASLRPCQPLPEACGEQSSDENVRIVEFLFATNRTKTSETSVRFSGERANRMTFGSARVHVPTDHRLGRIELPKSVRFIGLTLYEQTEDPAKHFMIKEIRELSAADWKDIIETKNSKDALIFVHGFNTSFDESIFRFAQVIWDLQYGGLPVLFSWPSRGGILNYIYDQQSALIARNDFLDLIQLLRNEHHITKINVLAHSMGNLLVLDALAQSAKTLNPTALNGELLLAAPDVDIDYFPAVATAARSLANGTTLYASSADKALRLSKSIAGAPRAGDVQPGGPLIVQNIDSVDATSIGDDILGLNHTAFASSRSLINDIGMLLANRTPRLEPNERLKEIRKVPEGSARARYWRFSE